MTSFWLRKASTFAARRFSLSISFSCWACEPGDLLVETLELLLDERLALERLAREILPARAERLPCLALELRDVLLELLRLHLEALLRRDDVRDALLDVLEQLELLLVRVVERDRRIFRSVEELRDPRLDDGRGSAQEPCQSDLLRSGRTIVATARSERLTERRAGAVLHSPGAVGGRLRAQTSWRGYAARAVACRASMAASKRLMIASGRLAAWAVTVAGPRFATAVVLSLPWTRTRQPVSRSRARSRSPSRGGESAVVECDGHVRVLPCCFG